MEQIKVSFEYKIALIKLFRAYNQMMMKEMGFGESSERYNILTELYEKSGNDELTEEEHELMIFLQNIEKPGGLKRTKDFVEEHFHFSQFDKLSQLPPPEKR